MLKKKMLIMAAALIALLAAGGFAQQSFFIAPGTEIRSGQVTRGYCLERTQDLLTTGNIGNLTNLMGNVMVAYKDGSVLEKSFAELYRNNPMSITGFNSANFIKMSFDPSIDKITVGGDGIIMARKDADVKFITNNAKTIMDATSAGASASEAQEIAWQSEWKPAPVLDEERNIMVVDNRGYTGTKAGEELLTELAGSAEVNNRYPNGRRDSFDTAESALTGEGSVFFTHVDSDHLSGRALEQAQREGLRGALYVPMFLRGQSMENSRFNTLTALADSGEYEFDIQNLMCSLLPQNVKGIEHITNGSIADFLYSLYLIDNGTESPAILEVFRHLNPRNTNADGAIYRYTYKGISWLLPGDFDDERALTELLEASEENVKKRAAIGEEITRLNGEAYAIPGYEELMEKMTRQTEEIVGGLSALAQRNNLLNRLHSATGEMVSVYSGELIVNEILAEGIFYELESLENELAANPAYQQWSRINDRITELNRTYSMLPALRSHYLKWPHHAHIFKDGELYGKIKSAVNPFYTIFQPHPTQKDNLETFKALLKEHGLEYLDSSEHPVEMQSFEHRPRPGCRAG